VDAQKAAAETLRDLANQETLLREPLVPRSLPPPFNIKQYTTACEDVAGNIPRVGNFWRFYDIHRVHCVYLIEHHFSFEMATSGRMPLTLFRAIWSKAEFFRPILAAMVIHGDLDFFHVDMFNLLFGNLPAYTLSFRNRFLHQLKKEVAGDPKYGPETPKCPIPMETPS